MAAQPQVFNTALKHLQRTAAYTSPNSRSYDYLRTHVANSLVARLDDIKRPFPLALDLGSGPGYLSNELGADSALTGSGGIGGVEKIVNIDGCIPALERDQHLPPSQTLVSSYNLNHSITSTPLPFPDASFDLAISSLSLHFVNDLPNLLSEVNRVLKPDGCLLFAMPGGGTLPELRSSLILAESERKVSERALGQKRRVRSSALAILLAASTTELTYSTYSCSLASQGGVSPRVGPFVDPTDVGTLLTSSGFKMPTVDVEDVKIGYADAYTLMRHLGGMGESNAGVGKVENGQGDYDTFLAASCLYREMFGELGEEGDDILGQEEEGEGEGEEGGGGIITSPRLSKLYTGLVGRIMRVSSSLTSEVVLKGRLVSLKLKRVEN